MGNRPNLSQQWRSHDTQTLLTTVACTVRAELQFQNERRHRHISHSKARVTCLPEPTPPPPVVLMSHDLDFSATEANEIPPSLGWWQVRLWNSCYDLWREMWKQGPSAY